MGLLPGRSNLANGQRCIPHTSLHINKLSLLVFTASNLPSRPIIPASVAQKIKTLGQFVTPTMAIFRIGTNSVTLSKLLNQTFNWNMTKGNAAALHKAGVQVLAGTDVATLGNLTMPLNLECTVSLSTSLKQA